MSNVTTIHEPAAKLFTEMCEPALTIQFRQIMGAMHSYHSRNSFTKINIVKLSQRF